MSTRAQDRGAFTLIEVMIALGIFAMAAIALGTAYVNVLIAYEKAARGTLDDEDLRFARQQLLLESDLRKVEEGGEFEGGAGRRLRWHARAEGTNLPDLFTVEFICEITDGTKTITQKEQFRLLRPSWSEPAERDKLRQEVHERILDIEAGAGAGKGGAS